MAFLDDLPEVYRRAKLPRREDGAILVNDVQIASTFQCRHCGSHRMIEYGKEYGWCPRCAGPTCERAECNRPGDCMTFEKWLETVERNASREVRLGV